MPDGAKMIAWAPLHAVCADGSVWSRARGEWRQKRCSPGDQGYPVVSMQAGMLRARVVRVHRLVAEAFLPPALPGQQVRHLNGVRSDCRAENLAWGSAAENQADRIGHGTSNRGERNGRRKLSESDIPTIRAACDAGETHRSIASRYGVCRSAIGAIVNGKRWQWLR